MQRPWGRKELQRTGRRQMKLSVSRKDCVEPYTMFKSGFYSKCDYSKSTWKF